MIEPTKLHRLIFHLSSSEKGYVKKHLNIHPTLNKKNLLVFDTLEKQKAYNDTLSKQKIGVKDYQQSINVLYGIILNCLESYHKFEQKEIRCGLNQIEILIEKNLYQQAEKLISKIKSQTDKKNYHILYSEVTDWEISLLGKVPPSDELQKTFDKIFDRLNEDIKKEEKKLT